MCDVKSTVPSLHLLIFIFLGSVKPSVQNNKSSIIFIAVIFLSFLKFKTLGASNKKPWTLLQLVLSWTLDDNIICWADNISEITGSFEPDHKLFPVELSGINFIPTLRSLVSWTKKWLVLPSVWANDNWPDDITLETESIIAYLSTTTGFEAVLVTLVPTVISIIVSKKVLFWGMLDRSTSSSLKPAIKK